MSVAQHELLFRWLMLVCDVPLRAPVQTVLTAVKPHRQHMLQEWLWQDVPC